MVEANPSGRIVRANQASAIFDADVIIRKARDEADRLRAEAKNLVAAEQKKGFEAGRAAGAEEIARLLVTTKAQADRFWKETEQGLVAIVMTALKDVLGAFDDKKAALTAIQHALSQQTLDRQLTLYVVPEMVDDVAAKVSECFEGALNADMMTVKGDPRLSGRRSILASNIGFVELGIEDQLAALERGLHDSMELES